MVIIKNVMTMQQNALMETCNIMAMSVNFNNVHLQGDKNPILKDNMVNKILYLFISYQNYQAHQRHVLIWPNKFNSN